MKNHHCLLSILAPVAALALSALAVPAFAADVRKSSSAICHCPEGRYYSTMKSFTSFPDLESCLSSGGREPKSGQGQCGMSRSVPAHTAPVSAVVSPLPAAAVAIPVMGTPTGVPAYDREAFRHWSDEDGDCINTRHEVLSALSTGPVRMAKSGCSVVSGRWNDPYTGKIHSTARDLDVDHLVPLKFAWDHGAWRWSTAEREAFANDPRNLFAVEASINREKGAQGPLEWLPPNPTFRCEYVLRFERISRIYGLVFSSSELAGISDLKRRICK